MLSGSHWAIILAGGDGRRMRPFISEWLGEKRPKQFCTFVGTRSMLQHTLDRASSLVASDRILAVINRKHERFLECSVKLPGPSQVVAEPSPKGTAVALLMAAARVMARDPEAVVLVFPSDHFVFPEDDFLTCVARAGLLAGCVDDRIVLLGAAATKVETDYGWIEPGEARGSLGWASPSTPRSIIRFHEKPTLRMAKGFLSQGYLWNTLVMAVKVRTLWRLARKHVGDSMLVFEEHRRQIERAGTARQIESGSQTDLERLYKRLSSIDLSKDLLQRLPGHLSVLPMNEVYWSDWGRPRRIEESLQFLGKRPLFQGLAAAGESRSPESASMA